MRKVTSYLFLAGSALFLLYACTKSGSSTTIIGNWVNRFDFDGISRTEAVSFTIADTAFVGTGYAGAGNATATNDRLPDFWKYNVNTNSWTQVASLPDSAARSSAVAFGTTTKGYIATGLAQDGITKMKDTWEYTPGGGWVKKADFAGTARYDAVGFCISDKGYIATGYDNNYLKDFYIYDPTANSGNGSWTQLQSFQGFKRKGAVAFVYSNKAYICTGQDNTTYPNDFWVYDPSASTWTQKRQIANVSTDNYDDNYNIIRTNAASFVMNSKAYVCTGENGSLFKSVWEYDFASDLWVQKTDFEGGTRTGAVGFAVKQRGFLMTGNVSSQVFSDFWEFHPTEEYNQYD